MEYSNSNILILYSNMNLNNEIDIAIHPKFYFTNMTYVLGR